MSFARLERKMEPDFVTSASGEPQRCTAEWSTER